MNERPLEPRVPLFPADQVGPALEATLFWGLPGAPPLPTDPEAWKREYEEIDGQRLAGVAVAALRQAGIALPSDVEQALRTAARADAATTLLLQAEVAAALTFLDDRGIPTVVTKGLGIALAEQRESLRSSNDVDIVVRPDDFKRAVSLLRTFGFERSDTWAARPWFTTRCHEGLNLYRPDGLSVDVHHHIPPWAVAEGIDFDDLLRYSRTVRLGDHDVVVAGFGHNLLIASLHLLTNVGGPGRHLRGWRDVALLAHLADLNHVLWLAAKTGLAPWLRVVLAALPASVQPHDLVDDLGAFPPTRADRIRFRGMLPPYPLRSDDLAIAFRLPAGRAASYVAGQVVPSKASIELRLGPGHGLLDFWRAAARDVVEPYRRSSRAAGSAATRPSSANSTSAASSTDATPVGTDKA